MKKASIKISILIPSLVVLMIGIFGMVATVGTISSRTTNEVTGQLIEARVNEYTNEFRVLCRDVYGAVTAISPVIANYIDPDFVKDVADPRDEVIKILGDVLLSNSKISTMWTCWEPDAFDGKDSEYANTSFYDSTGRFIPCVYTEGNSYGVTPVEGYENAETGDFYQGAIKTGKPYITDPYSYNVGGTDMMMCTISIPILKDGKAVGVVGADIDLNNFVTTMNSAKILSDGYMLVISPAGLVTTHPNKDMLLNHYNSVWMKNYSEQVEKVLAEGGSFNVNAYSDVIGANISFLGSSVVIGDTGRHWLVCGIVPESTVNASSTTLLWTIIAIGLGLIVVVGSTILIIVRGRLKDLPVLTATAEAMAIGDIDTPGLGTAAEDTKNEIALLGNAFTKMTSGVRQQAETLSKISKGDYSMSVNIRSEKDVINQAIDNMLSSTNDTLNQINNAASQVLAGSKQIADGAQSLAQGSTEQSSAVEELSASINDIAEQTRQNAVIANEAAGLSGAIKENAEKGSIQMEQMMNAVEEINEASGKIKNVIKIIDEIAFQTNILALNAAVEAARAGQHGKGFAVVADEVRSLAAKSAEAAKDTGVLIENSIKKANLGLDIATSTSASLKEIVEGVNHSANIVSQIARSSDEQATAINQINTGIEQVVQVIQQNSATAEESAASSQEMNSQSDILASLTAQFRLRDTMRRVQPNSNAKPLSISEKSVDYSDNAGFGKY